MPIQQKACICHSYVCCVVLIVNCCTCVAAVGGVHFADMDFKTRVDIQQYLNALSKELGTSITDQKFANELDSRDPLAHFRLKFSMPTIGELLEGEEIASGHCLPRCLPNNYVVIYR